MTEFKLCTLEQLPSGWRTTIAGDFRQKRSRAFNPRSAQDKWYELYSVPSHANGIPEIVSPSAIGSNKQKVSPYDVLISKINPRLNRTWSVGLKGQYEQIASTEWVVFPKSAALESRFLAMLLADCRLRDFLAANASGVGGSLTRVRPDLFDQIEIPVPPLNEQRRIVEKVEALFAEIDKGVESLKTARTTLGLYRQSLLKSAFEGRLTADWRAQNADKLEDPDTLLARIKAEREARYKAALEDWQHALDNWRANGEKGKKPRKPKRADLVAPLQEQETTRLPLLPNFWKWGKIGELFRVFVGSTPSRKTVRYWNGSIKWVSSGEVHFNRIRQTSEHLTDEGFTAMSAELHPPGTVMLGMIGEGKTRGQVAILECDATHNQNCAAIRVSETEIPSNFVYEFFRYRYAATRAIGSGNNQKALNKTRIQDMPFPICSTAEQAEIVRILDARLEAADALEAEIDAALKRADALRQSILNKAFSGRLVPQDPDDEPAADLLARIKAERGKAPKVSRKRKATA